MAPRANKLIILELSCGLMTNGTPMFLALCTGWPLGARCYLQFLQCHVPLPLTDQVNFAIAVPSVSRVQSLMSC